MREVQKAVGQKCRLNLTKETEQRNILKNLYIRVKTEEQLSAVAEYIIRSRMLPEQLNILVPCHWTGTQVSLLSGRASVFADLPYILRENIRRKAESCVKEAQWADGFVIKNIDEMGLVQEMDYQGKVIADSFLYATNSQAMEFYRQQFENIVFMASDELTDAEIDKMPEGKSLIYKIYGRQPVMFTAQDVAENYGTDGVVSLESAKRDRLVTSFDEFGFTTVYTEDAVSMMDKAAAWERDNILIDLTLENKTETLEILGNVGEPAAEYTGVNSFSRGHHYRGID